MRLVRVAVNLEQLLYRSPGGVGRYTARLAMVLPRLFPGDEVLGFTARHRPDEVEAAMAAFGLAGVHPSVLPLPRPVLYEAWHRLAAPPLAWGAGLLAGADLVHAPSVAVPPRGRVPLVVTVHDAAPELFPDAFPPRGLRFHRAGLAAATRRADLVLTVSESAAEEIVAHSELPRSRIRVVPNGVDPVPVTAEQQRAVLEAAGLADRPYVFWVGSLEPRKGVGTLVAAMARLHPGRGGRSARLVLAGYPGWLSGQVVDAADRAELGDDLVERGRISDEELWALYAGAAVFAFPSRHEGFGYPVLEAMAQGTPVVCSDLPVLREVTGDAAMRVAPGDVAAWAEAIAALLDDPAAALRQGAAGRAQAEQWSVERSIRGIRGVYEEVLGRRTSGDCGRLG
jgi:glycosyltransferase involved in cell wall biosynthesis